MSTLFWARNKLNSSSSFWYCREAAAPTARLSMREGEVAALHDMVHHLHCPSFLSLLEVGSLVGSARVPVCPCARGFLVCPCARVPVCPWIGVVPVCPCARGSGCARVPVCPGQLQKSRSHTFAGSCSLSFGSPNSPSTVRGSYGRCKGRCLIWVLLTLVCSLLPVNFRMVRLL